MLRTCRVFVRAVVLLLILMLPLPALAGPTLVFDVETGTVLHSEDTGAPWYPASLTKLMTAYLTFHAIRAGRITLETKIAMTEAGRAEPPSKVGLPVGTEFSIEWALQVLIVRSANDIAVALAEGVAGSEEAFVRLMNETAQRLAMTGTYYANPHGLPDRRQVTTARDLGLLARAIVREFPEYQAFFEAPNVRVGGRRLRNRNGLLRTMEGADGMKTGFICNSGYNLVASATRNGRRLVAVILGAPNGGSRTTTAKALLEEGFANDANGGLLALPRKLNALSNGGLFAASLPEDMAQTVCRRAGTVRITQAQTVRGWSVALGAANSASAAQDILDKRMAALRNVFFGGRAVVVRAPDTGQFTAMVHSLQANQSTVICSQVIAQSGECSVLPPDAYREVIARLEEEDRARQQEERKARQERQRRRREQAAASQAAGSSSASATRRQSTQREQGSGSSGSSSGQSSNGLDADNIR